MTTQELIFRVGLVGFGSAIVIALVLADARSGEYDIAPVVKIGGLAVAVFLIVASLWGVTPT